VRVEITFHPPRRFTDMPSEYVPIGIFLLVALGFAGFTLFMSRLVQAGKYNQVKLEPYECGIAATSVAFDHRFSVRYFMIAVLFIVFDVETVFLFPWAIRFKQLGWFGAVEMATFLAILLIGYFYAWKRKVLTWV
jgi:NADH-quinone oxidoreductase subunit A